VAPSIVAGGSSGTSVRDADVIRLHDDEALFLEALGFTAASTGFAARLIEKDYFCTLVLRYLARQQSGLVFKGGTCLAKVHLGFYRLSEDLDFAIPMDPGASRGSRRARVAAARKAIAALPGQLQDFHEIEGLTGANDCAQYNAILGYTSYLSRQPESIRIEISLRERLLQPVDEAAANTLLLDPITGEAAAPVVRVPCVSGREAIAEKLRAALSRRDPAIRDFFDVDYAVGRLKVDVQEPGLLMLVMDKLAVPGNGPVDVSAERIAALRPQVDGQLRPVLRSSDFEAFDLERAFRTISDLAAALGRR